MWYFGVNFVIIFVVTFWCSEAGQLAETCNFNVKVKQFLRNEGFHRNLTYGIVFNADDERARWLYQGCVLGIDQTLPRGVFVNPDELVDLRRSNRVNAIPKNKVNVEMPAEDSEQSSVYVIGKVTASKVYLWLPVHARYHRAVAGGGVARNEIPAPKLYLRCPDDRLDVCDKDITPSFTFLCNGSSKEKCTWKEIPFTLLTKPISWEVPVGNTNDYYIVASGTAGVILLGSIYLIMTIHEYKLSDKKKQY